MDLSRINFHEFYELRLPDSPMQEDGIDEIMRTLAQELALMETETLLRRLPEDWVWDWKVEHGTYSGTLPKRIQNWLYKSVGHKLSVAATSQIGNIVDRYTLKASKFRFDFDHDFMWERGQYGDAKSCLWSEKPNALTLLKYMDGFAIRLYDPDSSESPKGVGRALVLPWSHAGYKHGDLSQAEALLVFNGYGLSKKEYENSVDGESKTFGKMQTLDYGRALAMFLGLTYERVSVTINGSLIERDLGRWYLNNKGHAVMIGPVDVVRKFKPAYRSSGTKLTPIDIRWTNSQMAVPYTSCQGGCGRLVTEWETSTLKRGVQAPDGRTYCEHCFARNWAGCQTCAKIISRNSRQRVHSIYAETSFFCDEHVKENSFQCRFCKDRWSLSDRAYYHYFNEKTSKVERRICCLRCYARQIAFCQNCSRDYERSVLLVPGKGLTHTATGLSVATTLQPCPHCRAREAKSVPDKEEYLPDPLAVLAAEVETISALEVEEPENYAHWIRLEPDPDENGIDQLPMSARRVEQARSELQRLHGYFAGYNEDDFRNGHAATLNTEGVRAYPLNHAHELRAILEEQQDQYLPRWLEIREILFRDGGTRLTFGYRQPR